MSSKMPLDVEAYLKGRARRSAGAAQGGTGSHEVCSADVTRSDQDDIVIAIQHFAESVLAPYVEKYGSTVVGSFVRMTLTAYFVGKEVAIKDPAGHVTFRKNDAPAPTTQPSKLEPSKLEPSAPPTVAASLPSSQQRSRPATKTTRGLDSPKGGSAQQMVGRVQPDTGAIQKPSLSTSGRASSTAALTQSPSTGHKTTAPPKPSSRLAVPGQQSAAQQRQAQPVPSTRRSSRRGNRSAEDGNDKK